MSDEPRQRRDRPLRLLIVMPSWVGDAVMATPALRRIRGAMPGIFIGALCRPGIERLMRGTDLVDELHTYTPHGMMAPKKAATKVRGRRYDTALLLTNSFSTALIARLAFIDRRVGYDRDGRGVLLSEKLRPPKNADKSWRMVPAVDYYWNLSSHLLGADPVDWSVHTPRDCVALDLALDGDARMEVPITDEDSAQAREVLGRAQIGDERFAVLNPGGNNPKKRWPADRFAQLADALSRERGLRVLLNGSPDESELLDEIIGLSETDPVSLAACGNSLGSLKPILRGAALMVTNDTGPRHIAAALGTPVVSIFGPTDPRWTTIPVDRFGDGSPKEVVLVADPSLEPTESANDHPERCAVDRIGFDRVWDAAAGLLDRD